MLLRGATADEVAATRQQDHVGADPVVSFWRWQSPLAAEFTAPGARERLVHHRAGDRLGTTLLGMRVLELTLHGWDISHSVGLEESLDAALAEHLLDRQAALIEELCARGVCRMRPGVSAAADAPTLLLHRTGRG